MSQKFNILGGMQIVSGKAGWAALNRAAKIEKQAKDEASSLVHGGKIMKAIIKTKDSNGRKISIHIDRPLGGDEATCMRLPDGKVTVKEFMGK